MTRPDTAEAPRADKRLGQNFLYDRRVIDRIVAAIAPRPDDCIVEIGPGEGALTAPLLDAGVRVTALELDTRMLPGLERRFGDIANARILHADALATDLATLYPDAGTIRLVGNLPYNISTPLLFHVLRFAGIVTDMHFMLQREVVARMCAAPGGKEYGRLTVALAAQARVEALFDVAPGAFRPAPKVTSTVVRLRPAMPEVPLQAPERLDALLRAAFAKRRKTLSNALAGVCAPADLEACGIDPRARAETVPVADWIRLANHLAQG